MPESAGPSSLLELPYDCLQRVLVSLAPFDLVTAVPRTCGSLRAAAVDDSLWRLLLEARYEGVLQRVFDGRCPSPHPPQTWRRFYFEFGAAWPSLALQEVGKVIVTLHGSTFDLTGFLDEHPGGPALLLAAAGADATAAYEAVGHSEYAGRLLKRHALTELRLPRDDGLIFERREVSWSMWDVAGRQRWRQLGWTALSAVISDLTEGRPDGRRLAPVVWSLFERRAPRHET
tara:strand:+ start:144 stop:836 length:693 start_codon:yes stop_codon:yes gene_type:complete